MMKICLFNTRRIKSLFIYLLILLLANLALPNISTSHGGGLDSYGCHHNRKQGGYHCHRGVFAGEYFTSKDEMLKKLEKFKNDKKQD